MFKKKTKETAPDLFQREVEYGKHAEGCRALLPRYP